MGLRLSGMDVYGSVGDRFELDAKRSTSFLAHEIRETSQLETLNLTTLLNSLVEQNVKANFNRWQL